MSEIDKDDFKNLQARLDRVESTLYRIAKILEQIAISMGIIPENIR